MKAKIMTRKKTRNITFAKARWGYDFTRKGKRLRKGGYMTKVQAEAAMNRTKTRQMDEELGLVKAKGKDVTFDIFADDFLETHSKAEKRSWKSDKLHIKSLKRFFGGKALRSITQEDIEHYRAARKVEPAKNSKLKKLISPSTANRELACLKTIFSKAVERGKIETSPAARVKKLKEPPGRETILTRDQARQLIEVATPEYRPIFIVALGTGMRRGEILALKWTDLDLIRGIITVTDSKSGKSRKLPMSGAVVTALGGVPRRGEYVFWNPETKTRIKDIKNPWAAACTAAKISGVRFHDCRHTALTWMLQSGADIVSVSKIAGHASIVMTQRYCHASPEMQRLAVNSVGEILEPTRREVDSPRDASSRPGSQVVEKKEPARGIEPPTC